MGIVVSWLLRYSRTYVYDQGSFSDSDQPSIDPDTKRYRIQYNESFAFYFWIHIIETLKYRRIYDEHMSKLSYHLHVVEEHLKCAFPEVYDLIMNIIEIDLTPVFTSTIATVFLADL
jgi:hypothetical protein